MTLKEKLAKEDECGGQINCYKQGAFWVCYEQSAYYIWIQKEYKPIKKRFKNINKEVVTVGFPEKALELLEAQTALVCVEEQKNHKVFKTNTAFTDDDFKRWKESINLQKQNNSKTIESLEQKISEFPLAKSTPIEAFLFLEKMQKEFFALHKL